MPFHLILVVFALVLLVVSAILDWPRANPIGVGYGHPLAWIGLACFVASNLVS